MSGLDAAMLHAANFQSYVVLYGMTYDFLLVPVNYYWQVRFAKGEAERSEPPELRYVIRICIMNLWYRR